MAPPRRACLATPVAACRRRPRADPAGRHRHVYEKTPNPATHPPYTPMCQPPGSGATPIPYSSCSDGICDRDAHRIHPSARPGWSGTATASAPRRWQLRAALHGTGAVLTTTVAVVFVASTLTSGAWVVVLTVPALMLLFSRIQSRYQAAGPELHLGRPSHRRLLTSRLVIVPSGGISKLSEHAARACCPRRPRHGRRCRRSTLGSPGRRRAAASPGRGLRGLGG